MRNHVIGESSGDGDVWNSSRRGGCESSGIEESISIDEPDSPNPIGAEKPTFEANSVDAG